METINEKSRLYVTFQLRDRTAALSTPTTLRYRVDCQTTNRTLVDWTEVTAASSAEILVTATTNAIQVTSNAYEVKALTVTANAGEDSEFNAEYQYRVRNLGGVN